MTPNTQKSRSETLSAPRAVWLALRNERSVAVISVFMVMALAALVWVTRSAQLDLVNAAAVHEAAQYSSSLDDFRTLYSSEVTSRVERHGVEISHDYAGKDGAIPLPATLTMLLGDRIAERGAGGSVRLYSDYPFPWREEGGPHDDFEWTALVELRRDPTTPFSRRAEVDGRPVLRYATADLMRESCVQCHNTHPQSPKRDWNVGEVRGVLEVTIPMDAAMAQANDSLAGIFALIGLLAVGGLSSLGFLVFRLGGQVREARRSAERLGRYSLEERIGEGGMGEVYRARHAMLRRPTAVKVLRRDRLSEEATQRFEREVQLTSQLTHPNTIAIYDFGRTPSGELYYAMEYLDGISVDALVSADGAQPEGRVIHILRQICDSLEEAHRVGLIHRDVKPANVMLCRSGGVVDFVKVLDFGLVKQTGLEGDTQLTSERTLTGTPFFMSPEAIRSPDLDARGDIYQVGLIAYFLLTGEHVFTGKTVVEICAHHLSTLPEPPSERLGRAVSNDLETLILQCLAKDRDDRPEDARSLSEALAACSSHGSWKRADAEEWWALYGPPPRADGSVHDPGVGGESMAGQVLAPNDES